MPKSRFLLHFLCSVVTLPLWADAVNDIAELLKKGDAKAALERSDDALSKSPRDMRIRFLRGVALVEQSRQVEAIQVFSALTVDHPNQPEPYNNLAVLYAQQGQLDKARAALQMAIQTNPAYATAQANLSDVYAKLAAQAYDKALQLDKTAPAAPTPPKLALVKDLYAAPATKIASARAQPAPVAKPEVVAPAAPPLVVKVTPTPTPTPVAAPKPTPVAVAPVKVEPVAVTPAAVKPIDPKPVEVAAKPVEATKPVEAKPPAVASSDDEEQVNKTLQAWAEAWAGKQVNDYLSHYAKGFRTPKGVSRSAWEQQRRERIEGVRKIAVRLSNIKIQFENGTANARFVQHYRSDRMESSTGKTLRLERVGNRWMIVEERVG